MKKNENIYIKLGLEKDADTGKLLVNILFDKDAPNFSQDKNTLSWCPTLEEWEYANEAYEIMSRGQQNYNTSTTKNPDTNSEPTEDKEHGFVDRFMEKKQTP